MAQSSREYVIYLRKSRADADAEARGEDETLRRHETALLALAKQKKLVVAKIYREIVSGETIGARPEMQRLLTEVEACKWAGVLVMEIERLARGDTIDQGIVAQTFQASGTRIITPSKEYDPTNEFDEEYFEFGLFMSRREYKAINRRLQRGRECAAKEGRFQGSRAPFGYERCRNAENAPTLRIVPEQAEIVRFIFTYFVQGMGLSELARTLNEMGITPPTQDYWQKATLRQMLSNPVYAGKIRWGYRRQHTKLSDGQKILQRQIQPEQNWILADGLHSAIIEETMFRHAQDSLSKNPVVPVSKNKELKNPLAGVVCCALCGRKMTLRRAGNSVKPDYLVCTSRHCKTVSSPLLLVEERLLAALQYWLEGYRLDWNTVQNSKLPVQTRLEESLAQVKKARAKLKRQFANIHDLLERGIYSAEVFLQRTEEISQRLAQTHTAEQTLSAEFEQIQSAYTLNSEDFLPKQIVECYEKLPNAAGKNCLLKLLLDKVVYEKDKSGACKGGSVDGFTLRIFPKLPYHSDFTADT